MDAALTVADGTGGIGSRARNGSGLEAHGGSPVSLQPQTNVAGSSESALPGSVPYNEESTCDNRERSSQNAVSSDSIRPAASAESSQQPVGSVSSTASQAGQHRTSAESGAGNLLVLPDKTEPIRKSSLKPKEGGTAMRKPAGKLLVLAPGERTVDEDGSLEGSNSGSRRPSFEGLDDLGSSAARGSEKTSVASEDLRARAHGMEPLYVQELWLAEDDSDAVRRGSQRASLSAGVTDVYNPSKVEARRDLKEIRRKLRSWRTQLRPWLVLSCYLAGGPTFIIAGAFLLAKAAAAPRESVVDYTDFGSDSWFVLPVHEDLEPPLYVYYELEDFSQGHRGYARSRDNRQLSRIDKPKVLPSEMSVCKPWVSSAGRVNYPCGLVARSIFNDIFAFQVRAPGSQTWETLTVDTSAAAIADESGAAEYENLDPEAVLQPGGATFQVLLHMWILSLFPPVRCEQTDLTLPFRPAQVAEREEMSPTGAAVKVPDCRGYMSGSPRCNFTRAGVNGTFTCANGYKTVKQDWGVENGHFRVWMHPSGLGTLRKPWARIDRPLAAGTLLNVSFADNFPIREAGGRKVLVLSAEAPRNGSRMGSAEQLLGAGYVTVGSVCTVAGFYFLVRHLFNSHPLSRVHKVDWQHGVSPAF